MKALNVTNQVLRSVIAAAIGAGGMWLVLWALIQAKLDIFAPFPLWVIMAVALSMKVAEWIRARWVVITLILALTFFLTPVLWLLDHFH